MDIEDPIRELLNKTGWSCDDLLKKLQSYKTSKNSALSNASTDNSLSDTEVLSSGEQKKECQTYIPDGASDDEESNSKSEASRCTEDSCDTRESPEDDDDSFFEECLEINSDITNSIERDKSKLRIAKEIPEPNVNLGSSENFVEQEQQLNKFSSHNTKHSNESNDEAASKEALEICTTKKMDASKAKCNEASVKISPSKIIKAVASDCMQSKETSENFQDDAIEDLNEDGLFGATEATIKLDNVLNIESRKSPDNIMKITDLCDIHESSVDHDEQFSRNSDEHQKPDVKITEVSEKRQPANVKITEGSKGYQKTEQHKSIVETASQEKQKENEVTPINNGQLLSPYEDININDSFEDIRNNLKVQLSFLRTKKKDPLLDSITKKIDFNLENNKKITEEVIDVGIKIVNTQKILENSTTSMENESLVDIYSTTCENQSTEEQSISGENCLYTQAEDVGFVIASVQGGIEFEDITNDLDKEYSKEQPYENIVTKDGEGKVIDQIREIIHKQKTAVPRIFVKKEFSKLPDHFLDADENKPEIKAKDKFNSSSSSNENSQSSFLVDGVEKISPFVSNTLDEFLTEDSQLNISYNVPKSGAERGLKETATEERPLLIKKTVKVEETSTTSPKHLIKAKTVAQKRKLLAQREMKNKNITLKKEAIGDVKLPPPINRSYVLDGNKKIWVSTRTEAKCVAVIGTSSSKQANVGKPSNSLRQKRLLLKESHTEISKINYKPGPLCKKKDLQISGLDDWDTELKTLPKLYVEVYPDFGKALPFHVSHRISEINGNLTKKQVDFALTALKTKNQQSNEPEKFIFPLSYQGKQEQVIVRKKKLPVVEYKSDDNANNLKNGEDAVADVMEGLLRYVEIKEIAPTIFLEEEVQPDAEQNSSNKITIENEKISVIRKRQKKKSKIDLELLRLNCKLVNVEVAENEEEEPCNKSFCQLGCVCKSLKCENISSLHCQKYECMFECSCPKEKACVYDHNFTLPPGSDILSTDTVSRIEDEAKRNLAKVEREFTQTIIYTNDKTIVVGLGGRNKTRRAPKIPKKFNDYDINLSDDLNDSMKSTPELRACKVSLLKMDLSEIRPFCLQHTLYDCHCKNLSNYVIRERKTSPDNHSKFSNKLKYPKKRSISVEEDIWDTPKAKKHYSDRKEYLLTKDVSHQNKDVFSQQKKEDVSQQSREVFLPDKKENVKRRLPSGRISKRKTYYDDEEPDSYDGKASPSENKSQYPIKTNKKLKTKFDNVLSEIESCARIRRLPELFMKKRIPKNVYKKDFIYNVNDSELLQIRLKSKNNTEGSLLDSEFLKMQLIKDIDHHQSDISKRKRKQILEARNIEEQARSIENEGDNQKLLCELSSPELNDSSDSALHNIQSVFPGEVILDNVELLKKIGPKALSDGFARLLPWKVLCESFRNGVISIWCMIDQPSRLLLNKSDKTCPKNYIDIRETTRTTDVILWILEQKLPNSYVEDSVSFILKETKNNFEICGMCNGSAVNPPKSELYSHKDVNGKVQALTLKRVTYKLQDLINESACDTKDNKNACSIWASLPDAFKIFKWRMIYLHSNFVYLLFKDIEYSIKYTDLLNISKIAKDCKTTVVAKNKQLTNKYDHKGFGLYFEPTFNDRVFIGPYPKNFDVDDVGTLRYVNKTLVCSESFNRMMGKDGNKFGYWMIERPYRSRINKPIDLTRDESLSEMEKDQVIKPLKTQDKKMVCRPMRDLPTTRKRNASTDVSELATTAAKLTQKKDNLFTHNGNKVEIVDAPPRKPEDFNRYLITNIPHFGYLGAYQHPNVAEIDVCWPFENKLLRFPSTTVAIDFLQERFTSLVQPIPDSFKIQIIVLTNIDLASTKPIDANVLSGHYVCGDFGFYNIKTVSEETAIQKIGLAKDDILRMFMKRAQNIVQNSLTNLAFVLNIYEKEPDLAAVVDKANMEINNLKKREKAFLQLKSQLTITKRMNAIRVFRILEGLPPAIRNRECIQFRSIINNTDVIEIDDSDDEESPTKVVPKGSPNSGVSGFRGFPRNLTSLTKNKQNHHQPECSKQDAFVRPQTKPAKAARTVTHKGVLPTERSLVHIDKAKLENPKMLKLKPVPYSHVPAETIASTNNVPNGRMIKGVKIVKTISGNLVVVSDKPDKVTDNLKAGTKIVIKNSKIQSVSKYPSSAISNADGSVECIFKMSKNVVEEGEIVAETNEEVR